MDKARVILDYILVQCGHIGPYWIGGLGIGSFLSVFLKDHIRGKLEKREKREKRARKERSLFGIFPAALLGIASPLCMYGTIPVVAAMARRQVPIDRLTSFMVCSILLNPQLVIYTLALGVPFAVMRFTVCLLAGMAAGILARFFLSASSWYRFEGFHESANRDIDPNLAMRVLKNMLRAFKITAPYFALGIGLTALYQAYFPQRIARVVFTHNPGFGVLFAAALGVPLYACGGGSIPLLAAWLDAGMTSGSAAAFMITGQAIKLTNLSAMKIILGAKHFALYIAFNILFAIITGLLIDRLGYFIF